MSFFVSRSRQGIVATSAAERVTRHKQIYSVFKTSQLCLLLSNIYKLTRLSCKENIIRINLRIVAVLIITIGTLHIAHLHKQTSQITGKTKSQVGFHIQKPIVQAAEVPKPAPVAEQPKQTPPQAPTSHEGLMAAAGIASQDYGYVDFIVTHESGWRVNAYNPSGATGLCQALPGSKMASAGADYLTNPVTQLIWCNSYAVGRYGSWANAHGFWLAHKWW